MMIRFVSPAKFLELLKRPEAIRQSASTIQMSGVVYITLDTDSVERTQLERLRALQRRVLGGKLL